MWNFQNIWNQSLEKGDERTFNPRDYCYASELGGSMVDRYLKMKGVQPTNPITARSLRKFEAGNLIEWIVKLVLMRAGLLRESQKVANFQFDGLLSVHGRLDFIGGGELDLEHGFDDLAALGLPEFFTRAGQAIIANLQGVKFEDCIVEVKSCSQPVFDNFVQHKVRPQHSLQATHYKTALNLPAKVVYICKDDLRISEFEVNGNLDYRKDIETITHFYRNNIQPPKEKSILFDYDELRFFKNWKLTYSPYLTMLYGFKNETEVEEVIGKLPAKWNRVFNRVAKGDKLTVANKEIIAEFEQVLPDWEELAEKKSKLVNLDESDLEINTSS